MLARRQPHHSGFILGCSHPFGSGQWATAVARMPCLTTCFTCMQNWKKEFGRVLMIHLPFASSSGEFRQGREDREVTAVSFQAQNNLTLSPSSRWVQMSRGWFLWTAGSLCSSMSLDLSLKCRTFWHLAYAETTWEILRVSQSEIHLAVLWQTTSCKSLQVLLSCC